MDSFVLQTQGRLGRLVSACSFGSRRAKLGNLVGLIVRVLDSDVGTLRQVQDAVWNQAAEIRSAGHGIKCVVRAMSAVHSKMPFLRLDLLAAAVHQNQERLEVMAEFPVLAHVQRLLHGLLPMIAL